MTLLGPSPDVRGQHHRSLAPSDIVEFAKLGSPSTQGTSQWREFYKGREGPGYKNYVRNQYKPFLDAIRKALDEAVRRETVLEVGCGLGTISHILTRHPDYRQGNTYLAIDSDLQMVLEAKRQLAGVRVLHCDMRHHGWLKADIIVGHGVLEHLSDLGIYQTLEAHERSGARVAIHYVPGMGWGKPSFGDERLETFHWWMDKWEPTEGISFNGGKDYCFIWRF